MLPKDKLERLIIEKLQSKVLTDENLEELVKLVNEELKSTALELRDRLDTCDAELTDVKARLSRLYDALETGKVGLDDLGPRIKELKGRLDELSKTRVQIEADMVIQGVKQVDAAMVKAYAQDLRGLLEESDLTERKVFLRSFIKRIEVNKKKVTIHYRLPLPQDNEERTTEVPPIVHYGGAGVSIGRTFSTTFTLVY